jgi:hypothetical protein
LLDLPRAKRKIAILESLTLKEIRVIKKHLVREVIWILLQTTFGIIQEPEESQKELEEAKVVAKEKHQERAIREHMLEVAVKLTEVLKEDKVRCL